jgi:gamma-tubulin complex component 5
LSILDMALHFSEGFLSFGGDTTTTLDVSRQSLIMKRHRSRRRRKQKRNVVGFSQFLQDEEDSSDQEEYENGAAEGTTTEHYHSNDPLEPSSFSVFGSSSIMSSELEEEDFFVRVERMSSELDGLVRFLRRGIESLAGGTGEAAPAFGVLAFALEDWDI